MKTYTIWTATSERPFTIKAEKHLIDSQGFLILNDRQNSVLAVFRTWSHFQIGE